VYEKVRGRLARVHRNNMDDFATGLLFIATLVYRMVVRNYFSNRLSEKLPKEVHTWAKTYEELEAFESMSALQETNRSGFRILGEKRRDTWNFNRLYAEISKKIPEKERVVLEDSVMKYIERQEFYKKFVDENEAHVSRDKDPRMLHALPNEDEAILDAVNLLDEFVEGEVDYSHRIADDEIDLKKELTERVRG